MEWTPENIINHGRGTQCTSRTRKLSEVGALVLQVLGKSGLSSNVPSNLPLRDCDELVCAIGVSDGSRFIAEVKHEGKKKAR